jgi:hypothetical protein
MKKWIKVLTLALVVITASQADASVMNKSKGDVDEINIGKKEGN